MSGETEIRVKLRVVGGKLLANKNAHLIRLESSKVGCNVIHRNIPDRKTYREVWRIKKDHWPEYKNGKATGKKQKGYSFVEVNHGGGCGGVQKSVRDLIIASLFGLFGLRDYRVIYEGVVEKDGGAIVEDCCGGCGMFHSQCQCWDSVNQGKGGAA